MAGHLYVNLSNGHVRQLSVGHVHCLSGQLSCQDVMKTQDDRIGWSNIYANSVDIDGQKAGFMLQKF